MAKAKKMSANIPVPQNDNDCNKAILELGNQRREAARLETEMNDQIAVIKDKYGEKVQPHNEKAAELLTGIDTFCSAHRDRLTNDNKVKFFRFSNGVISWRKQPAKVTLRKVEDVLKKLKDLKLRKFIRTKEEVDKEAILLEPKKVANITGISVGSEGEAFFVDPQDIEIADREAG